MTKGMSCITRKKVHRRDKVCQKCKTNGKQRIWINGKKRRNKLTVHHIKPRSTHPHLANNLNNCILLCERCHAKEHGIVP